MHEVLQRLDAIERRLSKLEGGVGFPPEGRYAFGSRSLANMRGVHPNLVACAFYALRVSPYDFGIPDTGGVRTRAVQDELIRRGKSNSRNSRHLHGLALDVYGYVAGEATWEPEVVLAIHRAFVEAAEALELPYFTHKGRKVRLRWGGDWNMDGVRQYNERDLVHHEMPKAIAPDDHVHIPDGLAGGFLKYINQYSYVAGEA